jgi:hypothetical protein
MIGGSQWRMKILFGPSATTVIQPEVGIHGLLKSTDQVPVLTGMTLLRSHDEPSDLDFQVNPHARGDRGRFRAQQIMKILGASTAA